VNRSTNRGDEISTYASELRWILEEIVVALEGLTAAQLDWRPAPTANSAHAIARRVVAATRVYALGFGCGHAVERNRAEEFTGTGSHVRDVIDAIRQLSREISGREALVESIRHAALHLGELRLTRDLAKQHG